MTRLWFEPLTFLTQSGRSNHYTTESNFTYEIGPLFASFPLASESGLMLLSRHDVMIIPLQKGPHGSDGGKGQVQCNVNLSCLVLGLHVIYAYKLHYEPWINVNIKR